MRRSPVRGDRVAPMPDQMFRVVMTGAMPDDPARPALLLEWRDGCWVFRCWAPAGECRRILVQ